MLFERKIKIHNKTINAVVLQNSDVDADVDIIMPAYKDRAMANCAAKTFFHFEKNLKMRIIFVDNSGSQKPFESFDNRVTSVSIPDEVFNFTDDCGKMSHSNAYALEVGKSFCKAPYIFVCHNDVIAFKENWLTYLHNKMKDYKLAAFLRDNIRINAAHVSGFMFDRKFFENKNVGFWPASKPTRDVGDEYSYYMQQNNLPYFVCPCTHNDPSLDKQVFKNNPVLNGISGDKCLDDKGNVLYIHVGRGTVKMLGHYNKKNKTSYKEWIKFAERYLNASSV